MVRMMRGKKRMHNKTVMVMWMMLMVAVTAIRIVMFMLMICDECRMRERFLACHAAVGHDVFGDDADDVVVVDDDDDDDDDADVNDYSPQLYPGNELGEPCWQLG